MANLPLKTASVEILEGMHSYTCDVCEGTRDTCAMARYHVCDSGLAVYTCARHLSQAVDIVAARKRTHVSTV